MVDNLRGSRRPATTMAAYIRQVQGIGEHPGGGSRRCSLSMNWESGRALGPN